DRRAGQRDPGADGGGDPRRAHELDAPEPRRPPVALRAFRRSDRPRCADRWSSDVSAGAPRHSSTMLGALAGLGAAALFGLSAPLGKRLVGEIDPQLLAGLLYGGAALGFWAVRLVRGAPTDEAPLTRKDVP